MKAFFRYGPLANCLWLCGCGCGLFPFDPGADYLPVTTIWDAKSGYYVELAQIDTVSSHGYAVYVFKDAGPRGQFNPEWKPVINVAGIQSEPPQFYVKNGCYILEVEFGYGGLVSPIWKDQNSSKTVCFDLLPVRGPKGGFTP